MDKTLKKTCITVRRASRHPLVQRSLRSSTLLRKHAVRSAVLSFVPATLNDVVLHHAPLTVTEVVHTVTDTISIGTMNTVIAILTIVSKTL
jgi:hypothetical protein